MERYFKEEYVNEIKDQRKKTLLIYYAVLAVYLIICVTMFVLFRLQPYEGDKIALIKTAVFVATGLFVIFSFIYLGIPFKRVNRYYKMSVKLLTGLQSTTICHFVENNDTMQDKDGVDMKSLTFLEWSEKKQDYYERKVLVLYEKPFPEIPSGAKVKVITVGNLLLEYEILEEGEQE